MPKLLMGYRMSKHASLANFSPYFLLFGRQPILGMSLNARLKPLADWTKTTPSVG